VKRNPWAFPPSLPRFLMGQGVTPEVAPRNRGLQSRRLLQRERGGGASARGTVERRGPSTILDGTRLGRGPDEAGPSRAKNGSVPAARHVTSFHARAHPPEIAGRGAASAWTGSVGFGHPRMRPPSGGGGPSAPGHKGGTGHGDHWRRLPTRLTARWVEQFGVNRVPAATRGQKHYQTRRGLGRSWAGHPRRGTVRDLPGPHAELCTPEAAGPGPGGHRQRSQEPLKRRRHAQEVLDTTYALGLACAPVNVPPGIKDGPGLAPGGAAVAAAIDVEHAAHAIRRQPHRYATCCNSRSGGCSGERHVQRAGRLPLRRAGSAALRDFQAN